ncbi:MAG: flagellar basal-body MS-ring/collar protein FliF [Paracoccaceae bacterium]
MQQLLAVWTAQSVARRVVALAAALAMFLAVLGLGRMASNPTMALLYAGLEGAAAGEVVQALEQRGVAYEVRGDSIFIDAAQRDAMRMTLATEGLPANGAAGYELLDGLTGFGTTSQMFDAAYWRAKEGELARTIMANPGIRAARVHISAAPQVPFRAALAPSASVAVTGSGGSISAAQAKAIAFLVSSAVAGLTPENVSVVDAVAGLVDLEDDPAAPAAASGREQELKHNVERLLEARVGAGRAIVEVRLETVTEQEQITERRFDPEGRVAISSETEERSNSSNDSGGAAVTVASNLPEGDAGSNSSSSSQNSESRERINYEVSEVQREVLKAPGAIRRLSVAVLVDGLRSTAADGTAQWEPRSEEEMAQLRELVETAVGYDSARGDVITLKSLQFEPMAEFGTAASASFLDQVNLMSLVQMAVLAIVVLVLGLFVLRPIMSGRALAPDPRDARLALPNGNPGTSRSTVLTGEIDDTPYDNADMPVISSAEGDDGRADDPVGRLRKLIEERQDETMEILRSWMEDSEEPA